MFQEYPELTFGNLAYSSGYSWIHRKGLKLCAKRGRRDIIIPGTGTPALCPQASLSRLSIRRNSGSCSRLLIVKRLQPCAKRDRRGRQHPAQILERCIHSSSPLGLSPAGLCPAWIVNLCSFARLWILRSHSIPGAGTFMRSAAPSIAGLQFRRRRQFAGCALASEPSSRRSTRQTPPRFSEGRQYRKPLKSCAKRRQHFLRSVSTGGHGRLGSFPSAWQPSGNRQAPVHRETRFPGAFPFAVPAANIVNGLQSCAKRACRPR